ncbi:MAG: HlyD family efflux transporter periplasmic adaptor subunit [Cyanobacteria bacterium P01_D01_bin.14]
MIQFIPRLKKSPPSTEMPDSSARAFPKLDKRVWRILIPLSGIALGVGLWGTFFWSRPDSTTLTLSGRIEGYETDVAAKVAGRIEQVSVREGAQVQRGELMVQLDDAELQAQQRQATARLDAARQKERQAALNIDVIGSQIEAARLTLQQSEGDATGRIRQAEASVASAQAQLAEAEAMASEARSALTLARADRDRYGELASQGAVTQQRYDQAKTAFETAQSVLTARQASVEAARRRVTAAQGSLTQTQTSALNPARRQAELDVLQKQLAQAEASLEAARAEVAGAIATQQEVDARLDHLTVESPTGGVVLTRTVEPGEVVAAGATLLTVLDPETVYLRGFIPEGDIGQVRIGQTAQVFLDSAPDHPLEARVVEIDSEASFTPENIYFREDRVQQVFGVKLGIDNPAGFAKPGMPADGAIQLASVEGEFRQ